MAKRKYSLIKACRRCKWYDGKIFHFLSRHISLRDAVLRLLIGSFCPHTAGSHCAQCLFKQGIPSEGYLSCPRAGKCQLIIMWPRGRRALSMRQSNVQPAHSRKNPCEFMKCHLFAWPLLYIICTIEKSFVSVHFHQKKRFIWIHHIRLCKCKEKQKSQDKKKLLQLMRFSHTWVEVVPASPFIRSYDKLFNDRLNFFTLH